jgi:hypothetical protein
MCSCFCVLCKRLYLFVCRCAFAGLLNLLPGTSYFPIFAFDTSSASSLPTTIHHAQMLAASAAASAAAAAGSESHGARFTSSSLRILLRHIMEQRSTRRIFLFLCINFSFMFVEAAYGLWTNSLGLISDAGHMLFDCAALGIGLYASYISTIQEDSVYTYG